MKADPTQQRALLEAHHVDFFVLAHSTTAAARVTRIVAPAWWCSRNSSISARACAGVPGGFKSRTIGAGFAVASTGVSFIPCPLPDVVVPQHGPEVVRGTGAVVGVGCRR